ncbi:MAG: sigma 54-interacting transcriptional regulator [Spirochaetota bacterium]
MCLTEDKHVAGVVSRAALPLDTVCTPEHFRHTVLDTRPEHPQACILDLRQVIDRSGSVGAVAASWGTLIDEQVRRGVPVVVVLPIPDVARAAAIMRAGACDCLSLPLRADQISESLARVSLMARRHGSLASGPAPEEGIATTVDPLLSRYAESDVPIFISGESGVGKEVAAHAIHNRSKRASGPFVARNCAAIPESLFESELFGSEPGAYTGAVKRAGAFEQAAGGTIFLDEIGELPPSKQAALLRVLEEQQVLRIGGRTTTKLNFRLITATNRRLGREVDDGRFRQDLYFRIRVLSLRIPPLRERQHVIPGLCTTFARSHGFGDIQFLPGALAVLQAQPWPGNVRQLRNVVQRICVLSETPVITGDTVRAALTMRD